MFSFFYHYKDYKGLRVSYKKQKLLTLREHISSHPVFCGIHFALLFTFPRCVCFVSLCSCSISPVHNIHIFVTEQSNENPYICVGDRTKQSANSSRKLYLMKTVNSLDLTAVLSSKIKS